MELLQQWKQDHPHKEAGPITSDQLASVIEELAAPSIIQTAINSPGAIQAAGNITIHNPGPKLQLVHFEGMHHGSAIFGESAILVFGADPVGGLANVIVEVTVEGIIDTVSSGITGTGIVSNRSLMDPQLDEERKVLTWGQQLLDPGCFIKIQLTDSSDLGRISWRQLTI